MVDRSPDAARATAAANAAKGAVANQTLKDMNEDFGPNGMFEIWALDELYKDHLLSQLE